MKRQNEFEDYIQIIIKTHGNVQLEHKRLSVRATEVMKESNNQNKLFTDVCSPYCTELGRQKSTEFVYQSPVNNVDWRIECKSRIKSGLLGEILRELNFVADIPEKLYCLVLSNVLLNQSFLKEIETTIREKNLSHKVWVGGAIQFQKLLIKCIKL